MSTWLTYPLPIFLFLVCAFFLADQMNLDSAMKKVAEACSPREVPLKADYIVGSLPLFLMVFATGVWSMFAYRLWYTGLGLQVAVILTAAFIFLCLPIAFLLAGAFIAFLLEEQWPRFYKDRVKLMLIRQREKYAKAGDTRKEEELGRILASWDMPASPPPPQAAPPAADEAGMRAKLQRLEDAKDAALELLGSEARLNESVRKSWVSDAKEVYYTTLAASQELTRGTPSPETVATCGLILGAARSRMERAASELKALKSEHALKIEAEMRAAFEDCWHTLCAKLPAPPAAEDTKPTFRWSEFFEQFGGLETKPEKEQVKPPEKKVIKVNDRRYELPCSVCGKTAVVWEIGKFKLGGVLEEEKESLLYQGIVGGTKLDLEHAGKIINWLGEEKIAEVHAYTREKDLLECGIDAYCPKCDQIFCGTHYMKSVEWDGSWYDCTYGTCPKGHRRMIDD